MSERDEALKIVCDAIAKVIGEYAPDERSLLDNIREEIKAKIAQGAAHSSTTQGTPHE